MMSSSMMITDEDHHLSSESCLLTLNYAWYHVIGCSLQLLLLFATSQTQFFEEANNFGIFAMLMDYGNMYLVKGTRTLQVVRGQERELGDIDDIHGIGIFLFFLWFDWLGAFALIVFARHVSHSICTGKVPTTTSWCVILFHTFLWWSAPPLSHHLGIDNRTLLLSRSSPKMTYIILLVIFSCLLFFHHKISLRRYLSIIGSGISCGLLHHLALFVYGMRGYDSILQLVITLATEWPALLCGESYIRNNSQILAPYGRILQRSMILLLVAMMIPHLPTDEQLTEYMISILPGQHMQTLGTNFVRFKTCTTMPQWLSFLPTKEQQLLDCRHDHHEDKESTIWLISTTSKSGAVISAKLLFDIAILCGECLGSGSRDRAKIPEIVHAPTYKATLLHAADMNNEWPDYVNNGATANNNYNYKCISMTRDPLHRLRSFYTYSRSGGEHWVRYETNITTSLRDPTLSLEESIQIFWDRSGKDYLLASHDMYRKDLSSVEERNCTEIRFEDLMADFQGTVRHMLRFVLEVKESAVEPLVQRMLRHDRTKFRRSSELLAKDPHASSQKYSKEFLQRVETIMQQNNTEIANLIRTQREDMMHWRTTNTME